MKLVAVSDLYNSSITSTCDPASSSIKSMIDFHLPSLSPTGFTIEQALIAPAFTSGVEGWSFSSRIAMIELKGSPVASAPILSSISCALYWFMASIAVGTFDTDSMPNL